MAGTDDPSSMVSVTIDAVSSHSSEGFLSMQAVVLQTPVAFFVFNRPDTTRRVFDAIARARPSRLLLIADGPRQDKQGEAEACREVRKIAARVDWPCEVSQNFSATNLGCKERVISGLDWVFSLVEEAIILEDDCLPDPSFFRFCQELLEKYRGDSRVSHIAGTNLVEQYLQTEASYFFSQWYHIWGWASWRSAWQRCDRHLKDWPRLRDEEILSEIFDEAKLIAGWTSIFDAEHENRGIDTWEYQWHYANLKNNALTIVPSVNLVANIGFGRGATHTTKINSRLTPPAKAVGFPLRYPSSVVPLRSLDRRLRTQYAGPLLQRALRKLGRAFRPDHGLIPWLKSIQLR